MNFFKLSSIFTLLFLATFAQRFYRYSNNGTQNELIYEAEMDDNLASDETNVEQDGNDVKLIRSGEVKLELSTKTLMFEYCSKPGFQRCMNKIVIVCYDSANPNSDVRYGCGSNQCEFKAGISTIVGAKVLWFMKPGISKNIDDYVKTCATAAMKSPRAEVSFNTPFTSCDPSFLDGNIVKLNVKEASEDCFLIVKNAKLWTPTTPSPTTSEASDSEGEETSNATAIWIIVGVGLGFLLLIIVGLSVWYYCTRMKKKTGNGKKEKKIIPGSQKTNVEAAVAIKETAEDKKEVVKPAEKTEDTKEKKETAENAKPAKSKKKDIHEKKTTGEEKKAEPSKEVTENEKVDPQKKASVEPTLDDPTTDASIVQPPHFPTVQVPKTQILPAPKSCGSKGDSHSSKKGSLSGRHEIMVESPPDSVKRHCFGSIDDATKEKLDKFYPSRSSTRIFEKREILLFCCSRVSIMFKGIEILIDMAIEALAERDVKFDDKDNIIEMSTEAEKYLRQKSTPEITRSFAFGGVFRDLIDSRADIYETYSIPLLFCIVLQRRYTVLNRRKAFIWIRRQLPIIYAEFTLKERKKLAYPLNAIEEMNKLDPEGFKDVTGFHTESGMEEDETQASKTHASEKNRKQESGGKKKKPKKRQ